MEQTDQVSDSDVTDGLRRQVARMHAEQRAKRGNGHTCLPIGPNGMTKTCHHCGIEMPDAK